MKSSCGERSSGRKTENAGSLGGSSGSLQVGRETAEGDVEGAAGGGGHAGSQKPREERFKWEEVTGSGSCRRQH